MNAIGYIRISTKDQSNYSLEYQEASVRDYCRKNQVNLLELFQDNGESSYTFDRPDWLQLEAFIKLHKGKVQFLVIMDHDRFSRNLAEALMKIGELEKKFGIKVISTNEPLDLDTSDPSVFLQRAFRYLLANEELFRIRKRTKQGIRQANESGRYVNRAPFGYINSKDPNGKNLILVNEAEAEVVRKIFHDYLTGVQQFIIHKEVKKLGFKGTGNSAIQYVLSNCTYAGLIKITEGKGKPDRYVPAVHRPIVTEAEYWNAQQMLANKRPEKIQPAEDFPLRGVLRCPCGMSMTAGWSKGKRLYYLYYRCTTHTNINIPGPKLHEQFEKLLIALSFDEEQYEFLSVTLHSMVKDADQQKHSLLASKSKELNEINVKIKRLVEKSINDEIDSATYKTFFTDYQAKKSDLVKTIDNIGKGKNAKQERLEKLLPEIKNLHGIYVNCNSIYRKHHLIRGVFKDNLTYSEGRFRTPYIHPVFYHKVLEINKKGLLDFEQPSRILDKNPIRTPRPNWFEPIYARSYSVIENTLKV